MSRHARERATQRYNIDLSYSDERNILAKLRTGNCIPIDCETNDENRYFAYVVYKNIPLKILYEENAENGKIDAIVTTYPFDVDEYNTEEGKFHENRIKLATEFLKANGYTVFKRGKAKKC